MKSSSQKYLEWSDLQLEIFFWSHIIFYSLIIVISSKVLGYETRQKSEILYLNADRWTRGSRLTLFPHIICDKDRDAYVCCVCLSGFYLLSSNLLGNWIFYFKTREMRGWISLHPRSVGTAKERGRSRLCDVYEHQRRTMWTYRRLCLFFGCHH